MCISGVGSGTELAGERACAALSPPRPVGFPAVDALSEIIASIPGHRLVGSPEGIVISDVVMRSDAVVPGSLFCCVPGSARDGHDFAADAVERGAIALLVDHEIDGIDAIQVIVDDVRVAMGPLADAFFDFPTRSLDVFGLTGTNGKTTTAHLLLSILEEAGRSPGLIGTVGARVGTTTRELGFTTPEAVELQRLFRDMVDAGNDSCAMEVSSHALDQSRASNVRFAAVGFSNLTRDHLDYHRSFEAYFHAKRRLFVEGGPEGQHWPAAINCDDEWGSRLFDELVHAERNDVPVWGFTLMDMSRASVSAKYQLVPTGASIMIESPVGDFQILSKLRGRFNVENMLCAATMALVAGIDPEHVRVGLERVEGVRGRFEPVDAGQPFSVFVDYAHTPDSLEQVLSSARAMCDGRVIAVFGCGGDRDRSKRPLMGRAAAAGADVAFVTSDNPRSEDPDAIILEIQRGMRRGAEVIQQPDRRLAIQAAIEMAEPGDIVLIAGKGHEQGQIFADETIPFDDASVARDALGSLAAT